MIFPCLETEDVVQAGDSTRLSAVKSFVSKDEDAITKVEICPDFDDDETFISVTGDNDPLTEKDWYLDWRYSGATREVTAKIRVTADSEGEYEEIEKTIQVNSVPDDALFSKDTDLIALEPDILKYVSEGRTSFLNVHRMAQKKIVEALDEAGVVDTDGNKLTKAAVIDVSEVRGWSRDLTLFLIFKSLINAVDDVFSAKANYYNSEVIKRKDRAILRLDLNGDGETDISEGASFGSMEMSRR